MGEVKRYKPVINDKPYKPYAYCEQNDEGIYVRIDDYAELKAQRDALAAENAAILSAIPEERFIDIMDENMDDVSLAEDIGYNTAVKEMRRDIKTPATDAYLNSVRAEGVEMFGNNSSCPDEMALAVNEFAEKLRAGESS